MIDPGQITVQTLFDKYINLYFYGVSASSAQPDVSIITPTSSQLAIATGININQSSMNRKPEITITGTFVNSVAMPGLQIRVTNMSTAIPIWAYTDHKMVVEVGYKSTNELTCWFSGKIMTAAEEKPGPDSITVFTLLLGEYDIFNNNKITGLHYRKGSGATLGTLLNQIATELSTSFFNYSVVSNSCLSLPVQGAYDDDSVAKVALDNIKSTFNVNIMLDGPQIKVIKVGTYSANQYIISHISSVTRFADSYTIKGPWLPKIRPWDQVYFNSRTFKQTLGGVNAPATVFQKVLTVDFEFSTTGRSNTMTLRTLNLQDTQNGL